MGKAQDVRHLTLMDLVKTVQDTAHSDREAVAVLAHLFQTRRVRYPHAETR